MHPPHCPKDLELHHSMVTAAKAALELQVKCGGTVFNLSIWAFKRKLSMVWDKVAESS